MSHSQEETNNAQISFSDIFKALNIIIESLKRERRARAGKSKACKETENQYRESHFPKERESEAVTV